MDSIDLAAEAAPERLVAAVSRNVAAGIADTHGSPEGPHPDAVSVRTADHDGHAIVIRTRYEIEVDGRPFQPHLVVDNSGRVHYHGLPTRDFASMVDLVKKAIETFPEDFAGDGPGHGPGHGGHGSGHGPGEPEPGQGDVRDPAHGPGGHEHGRSDDPGHDHGQHSAGSPDPDGGEGTAP
jgi:hypothetical protein